MKQPLVIYEDNHIIVAVKPAGFLSQADGSLAPDMLTWLKAYIKIKYNKPGEVYLGLVHRLDRPVAGLMLFARTSKAAARLSEQVRKQEIEKIYWAVCHGQVARDGLCEDYLYKEKQTNLTKVVSSSHREAKYAKLSFVRLAYFSGEDLSWVEIKLFTGRSHQIRVQFSSRNHPLYADHRYGKVSSGSNEDIALYAAKLSFCHPTTKEMLHFVAPKPLGKPWNLHFGLQLDEK